MNTAQKIVDKILAQAQTQADEITAEAAAEAEGIKAVRAREDAAQAAKLETEAQVRAAETVRSMKAVAGLDARKQLLAAKQEMITRAFDEARKTIMDMPRPLYAELLLQVICANANAGDMICPAQRDADVLDSAFIARANAAVDGGGLVLGPQIADIDSGCVIRAGAMERNCSLSALLRMVREREEAHVADILFNA